MIKILPWEGGSADRNERNPPKKLIDKPREAVSDLESETLGAFEIYYSAMRCALVCLCPSMKGIPDLNGELRKLHCVMNRSPIEAITDAARRFEDIIKEYSTDFLIEILFELIEHAAHLLPPPRRADWLIKWRDGFPLLTINEVQKKVQDNRLEKWSDLVLETQVERIVPKLHWYVRPGEKTSGFQIMEKIYECPHYPYFNFSFSSWEDIWTRRFKQGAKISAQLEWLVGEYWTTMHEWAHFHFVNRELRLERKPKRDPRAGTIEITLYIEDLIEIDFRQWVEDLFTETRTFILSEADVLFDEREPRRVPPFNLPSPETCQSLEQWHSSCTENSKENFDHMWERIQIAEDLEAMRALRNQSEEPSVQIERVDGERNWQRRGAQRNINELIEKGESETVEFKSTLSKSLRTKVKDKKVEKSSLRSIVAFLNSYGGTLIIGIEDSGNPVGLQQDVFRSEDKMSQHMSNLIKKHIGLQHKPDIYTDFVPYNDKRLMIVECAPSNSPVHLTYDDKDEFFIRVGTTTQALTMSEADEYKKRHFQQ